jgi:hypothetical protein
MQMEADAADELSEEIVLALPGSTTARSTNATVNFRYFGMLRACRQHDPTRCYRRKQRLLDRKSRCRWFNSAPGHHFDITR